MKISIGYQIQDGPWGGGNAFAQSLRSYLLSLGHQVYTDLSCPNLDIILLTDPRGHSPQVSFGPPEILTYLTHINPTCLVIHRINECDERKGTYRMNRKLRAANILSDHTVFISNWLTTLRLSSGLSPSSTIRNGADQQLYNTSEFVPWSPPHKLKLVTHHWGGNSRKGSDIYQLLDHLLVDPIWSSLISFTYIGNLPQGLVLRNSKLIEPLSGRMLASALSSHHAYVTASVNEPAGMHHIEAALSGLPILYRESGALPEYCSGYGLSFNSPSSFIDALSKLFVRYDSLIASTLNYTHTSELMSQQYLNLFSELLANKTALIASRRNRLTKYRRLLLSLPTWL